MDVVTTFLSHFQSSQGRFRMLIPEETAYEKMVREYEAGIPHMLEVMRLVVSDESTEEKELVLWKERAVAERSRLRTFVRVQHTLNAPDDTGWQDLQNMTKGASESLVCLYQRLDSAELYVDEEESESGLRFYPVSEMCDELEYVRSWLQEDEGDYEESEWDGQLELLGLPPWLDETVVFGGIGLAAERFLLACGGPYRGKVLAFDHDPLGMRVVADSFELFLEQIMNEPLRVAHWTGIYEPISYEHKV
ncbi:MAG: SMI1/KNR4 family protein [Pseudomonas sp.]